MAHCVKKKFSTTSAHMGKYNNEILHDLLIKFNEIPPNFPKYICVSTFSNTGQAKATRRERERERWDGMGGSGAGAGAGAGAGGDDGVWWGSGARG